MYWAKIKGVKETEFGTDLIVHIPEEFLQTKILRYKTNTAEIKINDDRIITPEQRRKIYATIKDISIFTGDEPEYLKEFLKFDYSGESGEEYFSLSNCNINTARNFINHIIDFVLRENIPLSDIGVNRTDDIDKYLYGCIKYRRCSITGRAGADIHHCVGSKVGMGNNRRKISNKGRELIALSRDWHRKVEQEGEEEIFKLYKIYGIMLDNAALRELKLSEGDIT